MWREKGHLHNQPYMKYRKEDEEKQIQHISSSSIQNKVKTFKKNVEMLRKMTKFSFKDKTLTIMWK